LRTTRKGCCRSSRCRASSSSTPHGHHSSNRSGHTGCRWPGCGNVQSVVHTTAHRVLSRLYRIRHLKCPDTLHQVTSFFIEVSACTTLSKTLISDNPECMDTGFGIRKPWSPVYVTYYHLSVYQNEKPHTRPRSSARLETRRLLKHRRYCRNPRAKVQGSKRSKDLSAQD
jgi:hypothetical protein